MAPSKFLRRSSLCMYIDEAFSSNNEKLDRSNFINGVSILCCSFPGSGSVNNSIFSQTKLLGTYLYEVAAIHSQN